MASVNTASSLYWVTANASGARWSRAPVIWAAAGGGATSPIGSWCGSALTAGSPNANSTSPMARAMPTAAARTCGQRWSAGGGEAVASVGGGASVVPMAQPFSTVVEYKGYE